MAHLPTHPAGRLARPRPTCRPAGWLPVMGGAQRSQRSTSRSGSTTTTTAIGRAPIHPVTNHRRHGPGPLPDIALVWFLPGARPGRWRCPVQHDPLRPTGRPGADKGPCEVATTGGLGMAATAASPRVGGQPAPADPQQERLKNRVIAAFQMQQLVEELAQREQAASDAAARCRDLEGRLSVMAADLEERRAVDRLRARASSGPCRPPPRPSRQGGPLRCRPDHQAPCIHPSAVHFDAEPHLQCWSGKGPALALRDI
ncbi:hypothetical protein PAPYR_11674 [Paratrimastix pyriformis]|uniref:Uncharacterized protein n=1 Tax=Paratrimastix pyriformis TaxID=342808 RepID=A0ABQ8U4Y7_9EUKA|nr:hypothetical protein PAPYR_11674 [Paratrimastix pyriformis]